MASASDVLGVRPIILKSLCEIPYQDNLVRKWPGNHGLSKSIAPALLLISPAQRPLRSVGDQIKRVAAKCREGRKATFLVARRIQMALAACVPRGLVIRRYGGYRSLIILASQAR